MLTLELETTEEQQIQTLAAQQGKPLNQLLKEIMRTYLEDAQDAELADKAIQELERGEDTLVSFDDVKQQLGL